MADADWRDHFVVDLDLTPFEQAIFTGEWSPTMTLGALMDHESPWLQSSFGPSLETRIRHLIADVQQEHPAPPKPLDWRTFRASDLDLDQFARREISNRFGLSVPLAHLDTLPLEKDDHAETGSPKSSRWVGAVRNQIAQMKGRYPIATPHKDLPRLPSIDYALLGEAMEFYEGEGYRYVEAPWAVSKETVDITCPNPDFSARVQGLGYLVGSAEQSFLHLDLQGQLGKGRFVACTPCFRLGDMEDDLHFPTFMKVELYDNTYASDTGWKAMLADALELSVFLGAPEDALSQEKTAEGRDLMLGDIEIGSFGLRRHGDHIWSYGTGLALPRFSQALERVSAARIPHQVWKAAGVNPLNPVPEGVVLMPPKD